MERGGCQGIRVLGPAAGGWTAFMKLTFTQWLRKKGGTG